MTTVQGPTASRRKLRSALRAAREDAKLTQDHVAEAMDWSLSKLIRIETGRVSVSTNDVRALLGLYGIDGSPEAQELIALARVARQKPWWQEARASIQPQYAQFIGLEAEASAMLCFQSSLMPGLAQTRDYARAVITNRAPGQVRLDEVDTKVEVRMRRKAEILERDDPPRFDIILDEAVLHRAIGGVEVHREQLDHLTSLAAAPNITIQVVRFDTGRVTAAGSFMILQFTDDADVVYLESANLENFLERPTETQPYHIEFNWLRDSALNETESLALIKRIADDL
ncbi:helix-turn-helix transcriptional regulator [Asanoa sp. WMMD1127]|uniref:helix-turn-helix domain-containing protein n=1 Tax=Asanoa sp. WMMD1127 TaxID=3016107 RepID=UPI002417C689|nr:helix-turn-helix transcriptional regulator [Asanoa sp. WMMD1127]MDG4820375.1 helix-turn-helix transcriptional regulator [Asanoa sp. WMMD1127]